MSLTRPTVSGIGPKNSTALGTNSKSSQEAARGKNSSSPHTSSRPASSSSAAAGQAQRSRSDSASTGQGQNAQPLLTPHRLLVCEKVVDVDNEDLDDCVLLKIESRSIGTGKPPAANPDDSALVIIDSDDEDVVESASGKDAGKSEAGKSKGRNSEKPDSSKSSGSKAPTSSVSVSKSAPTSTITSDDGLTLDLQVEAEEESWSGAANDDDGDEVEAPQRVLYGRLRPSGENDDRENKKGEERTEEAQYEIRMEMEESSVEVESNPSQEIRNNNSNSESCLQDQSVLSSSNSQAPTVTGSSSQVPVRMVPQIQAVHCVVSDDTVVALNSSNILVPRSLTHMAAANPQNQPPLAVRTPGNFQPSKTLSSQPPVNVISGHPSGLVRAPYMYTEVQVGGQNFMPAITSKQAPAPCPNAVVLPSTGQPMLMCQNLTTQSGLVQPTPPVLVPHGGQRAILNQNLHPVPQPLYCATGSGATGQPHQPTMTGIRQQVLPASSLLQSISRQPVPAGSGSNCVPVEQLTRTPISLRPHTTSPRPQQPLYHINLENQWTQNLPAPQPLAEMSVSEGEQLQVPSSCEQPYALVSMLQEPSSHVRSVQQPQNFHPRPSLQLHGENEPSSTSAFERTSSDPPQIDGQAQPNTGVYPVRLIQANTGVIPRGDSLSQQEEVESAPSGQYPTKTDYVHALTNIFHSVSKDKNENGGAASEPQASLAGDTSDKSRFVPDTGREASSEKVVVQNEKLIAGGRKVIVHEKVVSSVADSLSVATGESVVRSSGRLVDKASSSHTSSPTDKTLSTEIRAKGDSGKSQSGKEMAGNVPAKGAMVPVKFSSAPEKAAPVPGKSATASVKPPSTSADQVSGGAEKSNETKKPARCHECSITCCDRFELVIHVIMDHRLSYSVTQTDYIKCPFCQNLYRRKSGMRNHLRKSLCRNAIFDKYINTGKNVGKNLMEGLSDGGSKSVQATSTTTTTTTAQNARKEAEEECGVDVTSISGEDGIARAESAPVNVMGPADEEESEFTIKIETAEEEEEAALEYEQSNNELQVTTGKPDGQDGSVKAGHSQSSLAQEASVSSHAVSTTVLSTNTQGVDSCTRTMNTQSRIQSKTASSQTDHTKTTSSNEAGCAQRAYSNEAGRTGIVSSNEAGCTEKASSNEASHTETDVEYPASEHGSGRRKAAVEKPSGDVGRCFHCEVVFLREEDAIHHKCLADIPSHGEVSSSVTEREVVLFGNHSGIECVKCNVCHKWFESYHQLKIHQRQVESCRTAVASKLNPHHLQDSASSSQAGPSETTVRSGNNRAAVFCQPCGRKFASDAMLGHHLRTSVVCRSRKKALVVKKGDILADSVCTEVLSSFGVTAVGASKVESKPEASFHLREKEVEEDSEEGIEDSDQVAEGNWKRSSTVCCEEFRDDKSMQLHKKKSLGCQEGLQQKDIAEDHVEETPDCAICTGCQKRFSDDQTLASHLASSETCLDAFDQSATKYPCQKCGKVMNSDKALAKHLQTSRGCWLKATGDTTQSRVSANSSTMVGVVPAVSQSKLMTSVPKVSQAPNVHHKLQRTSVSQPLPTSSPMPLQTSSGSPPLPITGISEPLQSPSISLPLATTSIPQPLQTSTIIENVPTSNVQKPLSVAKNLKPSATLPAAVPQTSSASVLFPIVSSILGHQPQVEVDDSDISSDESSKDSDVSDSSSSGDVRVEYRCVQCGSLFSQKAALKKHLSENNACSKVDAAQGRQKKLRCKACGRKFRDLTSLQAHLLQQRVCFWEMTKGIWRPGSAAHEPTCVMCSKKCQSRKELRKHCFKDMTCRLRYVARVLEDFKLVSTTSPRVDSVQVTSSSSASKDVDPDVCRAGVADTSAETLTPRVSLSDVQDEGEENDTELESAANVSTSNVDPESVWDCGQCKEKFVSKEDFTKHVKGTLRCQMFYEALKAQNPSEFSYCITCKRSFGTSSIYRSHKCEDYKLRCVSCDGAFKSRQSLSVHERLSHKCRKLRDGASRGSELSQKSSTPEQIVKDKGKAELYPGKPKSYPCAVCPQKFSIFRLLLEHSQTHVEVGSYQCSRCSKSFEHYNRLVSHMAFHERMDKERAANTDNAEITSSSGSQEDQAKVGEESKESGDTELHKCYICEKVFSQFESFTQHIFSHAQSSHFSCSVCFQTYTTNSELEAHIREKHEKSRTRLKSTRPATPNSTDTRSQMRVLLRIRDPASSDDNSYTCACSVCGLKFVSERDRRKHLAVSSRCRVPREKSTRDRKSSNSCSLCQQPFNDSSSLQAHVMQMHGQKEMTEVTSEPKTSKNLGRSSYKCSFCHKYYPTLQRLHSHKKLMHDKRKAKTTKKTLDTADDSKGYKCVYCSLVFDSIKKKHEHIASSDTCRAIMKYILDNGFYQADTTGGNPCLNYQPSVCEFCTGCFEDKVEHILTSKCHEGFEDAVTRYRQVTSAPSLTTSQPDQRPALSNLASGKAQQDKGEAKVGVKADNKGNPKGRWICLLCGKSLSLVSSHFKFHQRETLREVCARKPVPMLAKTDEVCPWCQKGAESRKNLRLHIMKHVATDIVVRKDSGSRIKKCEYCMKKFSSMVALKSHIRQRHKKKVMAPDKHVSPTAQVGQKKKLKKELMTKDDSATFSESFKCSLCEKRYSTQRKLVRHERDSHNIRHLIRNQRRGKGNSQPVKIRKDSQAKTKLKKYSLKFPSTAYSCKQCPAKFRKHTDFEIHQRTAHKSTKVAEVMVQSRTSVKSHQETAKKKTTVASIQKTAENKPTVASIQKTAENKPTVASNQKTAENKTTLASNQKTAERRFIGECSICSKKMSSMISFRFHLKCAHRTKEYGQLEDLLRPLRSEVTLKVQGGPKPNVSTESNSAMKLDAEPKLDKAIKLKKTTKLDARIEDLDSQSKRSGDSQSKRSEDLQSENSGDLQSESSGSAHVPASSPHVVVKSPTSRPSKTSFALSSLDDVLKHDIHLGHLKFIKCKICHVSLANTASLQYHLQHTHKLPEVFTCGYCSMMFPKKVQWSQHERVCRQFCCCKLCKKQLSKVFGLLCHIKRCHGIHSVEDYVSRKTGKQKDLVHLRVDNGESGLVIQDVVSGIQPLSPGTSSAWNPERLCPICQKSVAYGFKYTQHLKLHMKACSVMLRGRVCHPEKGSTQTRYKVKGDEIWPMASEGRAGAGEEDGRCRREAVTAAVAQNQELITEVSTTSGIGGDDTQDDAEDMDTFSSDGTYSYPLSQGEEEPLCRMDKLEEEDNISDSEPFTVHDVPDKEKAGKVVVKIEKKSMLDQAEKVADLSVDVNEDFHISQVIESDDSDGEDEETEGGSEETEAGGEETEGGSEETEAGGEETEAGDEETEAGDEETEAGDEETEVGDEETEAGDEETEVGGEETEVGGEETEAGGEETEAGGEETEAGNEETEVGGEETEVGGEETEVGGEETEAGGEETKAGDEETEAEAEDTAWDMPNEAGEKVVHDSLGVDGDAAVMNSDSTSEVAEDYAASQESSEVEVSQGDEEPGSSSQAEGMSTEAEETDMTMMDLGEGGSEMETAKTGVKDDPSETEAANEDVENDPSETEAANEDVENDLSKTEAANEDVENDPSETGTATAGAEDEKGTKITTTDMEDDVSETGMAAMGFEGDSSEAESTTRDVDNEQSETPTTKEVELDVSETETASGNVDDDVSERDTTQKVEDDASEGETTQKVEDDANEGKESDKPVEYDGLEDDLVEVTSDTSDWQDSEVETPWRDVKPEISGSAEIDSVHAVKPLKRPVSDPDVGEGPGESKKRCVRATSSSKVVTSTTASSFDRQVKLEPLPDPEPQKQQRNVFSMFEAEGVISIDSDFLEDDDITFVRFEKAPVSNEMSGQGNSQGSSRLPPDQDRGGHVTHSRGASAGVEKAAKRTNVFDMMSL